MTEFEKMISGESFDGTDISIREIGLATAKKLAQYNMCFDPDTKQIWIQKLIGNIGKGSLIQTPFYCEFGINIHIGENSFLNLNITMLDGAPITIGNNVMIGPGCQFYTPNHPIHYQERRGWQTQCFPITIEDDVWIGGQVIITPGITVGSRSIIGANSLVKNNIPPDCLYAGSPAKLIRRLDE